MARKVIIWGMGLDYDLMLNAIDHEILKGNFNIQALVCRKDDRYCQRKDGFPVITKEDIHGVEFDYVIITSSKFFSEIKQEAISIGVHEDQIINGKLLMQPQFDFMRYVSLIENPVTILSDDCWGGYVYHRLCLPFSSPLINIYWNTEEYVRFIQKPLFYLATELTMEREGNLKKGIHPRGRLGTPNDHVSLELVHSACFAEAKEEWERRKNRINPDNLFVKMGFSSNIPDEKRDKYLEAFDKVNLKKILFYYSDSLQISDMMYTDRFFWKETTARRVEYFSYNDYLRLNYYWDLNVLKLLTGDKTYSRYL